MQSNLATLLTIEEAALYEDANYEAIRKRIKRDQLHAIKVETLTRQGFEYRIDISDLSEKARRRYYAEHKEHAPEQPQAKPDPQRDLEGKTLEDLTEEQRQQAYMLAGYHSVMAELHFVHSEAKDRNDEGFCKDV